ncbi:SDR family NAD(P)-dependent oxidoreductase [Streptomyces fimicarius]|uniref:SDR family NAD(P)-dependent oxidoreductase n=1 Tax=Streptomyces griseus TaxID=1911 RepID=UPI0036823737
MQYRQTTALVTGASSGIGAEFARRLAHRGADVVLTARRESVLESLATRIRSETGRHVHVQPCDLSQDRGGRLLAERLTAAGISPDTVVNCAGAGLTKSFTASSEADIRHQLSLNLQSVVDLSHALLPDLQRSGRGALVNIGSLTGYMPVPGMAVYAAAKAFVIRFTEALAYEVRQSGLTVMAVSPGPTRTGFYAASGTDATRTRFQTPEAVVTATLRALDRRHPPVSLVTGRANRWTSRLIRTLPKGLALHLAESRPTTST